MPRSLSGEGTRGPRGGAKGSHRTPLGPLGLAALRQRRRLDGDAGVAQAHPRDPQLPHATVIPGVIGEVEVEVPGVITQCPSLDHVQIQQKLNRKSEGIVRP